MKKRKYEKEDFLSRENGTFPSPFLVLGAFFSSDLVRLRTLQFREDLAHNEVVTILDVRENVLELQKDHHFKIYTFDPMLANPKCT